MSARLAAGEGESRQGMERYGPDRLKAVLRTRAERRTRAVFQPPVRSTAFRRSSLLGTALLLMATLSAFGQDRELLPPAVEALPSNEKIETAVDGAIAWLIANQAKAGSWGSHHSSRPIEVFATVPGSHDAFRVATTALGVMALSDAARLAHREAEGMREAVDRGIEYLLGNWDVKRVDNLEHYTVWALGYVLQALAEHVLHDNDPEREGRVRETCAAIVAKLDRYQALDGGWGYLSLDGLKTYKPSWTSMSFTSATVILGLQRAVAAGIEVPDTMLGKALDSVERCRMPSGAFTYGEIWNRSPVAGINLEPGAACRTPACLLVLDLGGRRIAEGAVELALENLLIRYARFQELGLRRPIPHESWYSISGYFYLYGQTYAAWLIEHCGLALRQRFASELARAILVCRQPDGSFWDYPLYSYHKPYGTAFALLGLVRVLPGAQGD